MQFNEGIMQCANIKYRGHKHDRGDSWKTASQEYLMSRLAQEILEFYANPSDSEAGDVLNFMSMILARRFNETTRKLAITVKN